MHSGFIRDVLGLKVLSPSAGPGWSRSSPVRDIHHSLS